MSARGALTERRLVGELMDDPALSAAAHHRALEGLARVNRLSLVARTLWRAIRPRLDRPGKPRSRPVRLLDVATGGGDVPIALARIARRAGFELELTACDLSATAIARARRSAADVGLDMRFLELDLLRDPLPGGFDLVTCSLFLHHLERADAVRVLGALREATRDTVIVSDLARSRRGLALARLGARLLTRSRVVHVDAVRSVEAAFTLTEARELATEAGLDGAIVRPVFPCRYLLTWTRDE